MKCTTHQDDLCYCDRSFDAIPTKEELVFLKILLTELRSDFPVTFGDEKIPEIYGRLPLMEKLLTGYALKYYDQIKTL